MFGGAQIFAVDENFFDAGAKGFGLGFADGNCDLLAKRLHLSVGAEYEYYVWD